MRREQIDRMLAAARDIVRHEDDPFTSEHLDPLTVEWARSLLAGNPPKHEAPLRALWKKLRGEA